MFTSTIRIVQVSRVCLDWGMSYSAWMGQWFLVCSKKSPHIWENIMLLLCSYNYNHIRPMVLIVMVMGSEASLVQGTCISSSWTWPLIKLNGSCSSCSNTSSLRSRLWNETSPPHNDTWNINMELYSHLEQVKKG